MEGSDIVQIGHPFYWDSDETKKNIKKGKAPFGTIHRLINDVSTGSSNIYGYDPEIILKCNYPTVISPYTFIDYDFRNAYKEVDHLQLDRKKFNKIYTNCSLIPFLSYFTLKKYGCVPYIKQYASEIRRKRPNLAQMNMYQNAQAESFSKLEIERMLEQYEVVINYVVGNRLTKDQIMNDQREQLKRLAPAFSEMFSVETVEKLLQDLSMIPYYMEYFEVSSDI